MLELLAGVLGYFLASWLGSDAAAAAPGDWIDTALAALSDPLVGAAGGGVLASLVAAVRAGRRVTRLEHQPSRAENRVVELEAEVAQLREGVRQMRSLLIEAGWRQALTDHKEARS